MPLFRRMKNIDNNALGKWLNDYKKPLVISGPCSAESEIQMLETAKELAKIEEIKIFRAGIWKPRTRPGNFEGVGEKGLEWLELIKKETGLKTAVEVANPQHIELALKHNVDVLWIGARTAVSPFSVQELAEALKGIDTQLLVKNPVNPEVDLWSGVLERFINIGINKIAAVHRGFYSFEKSIFRNTPLWEIPIELKRRFPGLPIICDPSHIAGDKSLIFMIAQRALDMDMEGLMIESHINPPKALTDAKQQISPAELQKLINKLVIREPYSDNEEFRNKLQELRIQIDKIDRELINVLAERFKTVNEIGSYKKTNNITILQIKRWSNIIEDRIQFAEQLGLDKDFLTRLLKLIHKESIRLQTEIMNKTNNDGRKES